MVNHGVFCSRNVSQFPVAVSQATVVAIVCRLCLDITGVLSQVHVTSCRRSVQTIITAKPVSVFVQLARVGVAKARLVFQYLPVAQLPTDVGHV